MLPRKCSDCGHARFDSDRDQRFTMGANPRMEVESRRLYASTLFPYPVQASDHLGDMPGISNWFSAGIDSIRFGSWERAGIPARMFLEEPWRKLKRSESSSSMMSP